MSKKVLLIGCGQLGSRHLQALASLKEISEIVVVDPTQAGLDLGQARLKEISDLNPLIRFRWCLQADGSAAGGELCLIATQAPGRAALLRDTAVRLGYKQFLVEKIVTQSVADYEDLLRLSKEQDLKVWVNCKTRAYEVHQYIKSRIDPRDPIIFTACGGNHGLGNNGIHEADMFVFYDGCRSIVERGSRVDDVIHPSKRGAHVCDLSGTIFGSSEKGSDFMLSFSGQHVSPDTLTLITPKGRFIVDHFQKFALESYPQDGWKWSPIRIDENWAVSHMTKAFAKDILTRGECLLPDLGDCYPAHKFILEALQPQFTRLLKKTVTECPVT
jgi:predicted dehydrogenase